MRSEALVGAVVASVMVAGCASAQGRFVRQRFALSAWCAITTIEDRRTGVCFVAYQCGGGREPALVVAPAEVCKP